MNKTEIDLDAIDRANQDFMEGAKKFSNWLAAIAIFLAIVGIIIPALLK